MLLKCINYLEIKEQRRRLIDHMSDEGILVKFVDSHTYAVLELYLELRAILNHWDTVSSEEKKTFTSLAAERSDRKKRILILAAQEHRAILYDFLEVPKLRTFVAEKVVEKENELHLIDTLMGNNEEVASDE